MIQLGEHFSNWARRHDQWQRQKVWFIKARDDKERRDKIEDKLAEDALALAAEFALATEIQIREFEKRLSSYDAATVAALMENEERMDAVKLQLQEMLDRAFVMEDGRRVFRTENGEQVFDEVGVEVLPEELEFDLIPPDAPTWEERKALLDVQQKLESERKELIEFQEKLDAVRDTLNSDEVSAKKLDDLNAELLDALPKSVQLNDTTFGLRRDAPDLRTQFSDNSLPLEKHHGLLKIPKIEPAV
ncbi:hypothetical protein [Roseibium album]|uniref:hypothetical protein n=1 Tax=Roseibium album TaxID=311410 RepID=UPI0032974605